MTQDLSDNYRGEERRKTPRIPVCLSVAAECDTWMGLCLTKDISTSGSFFISQHLPSIHSGFTVEIALPGDLGRVRMGATVVRVQVDHPRGFGLSWKNLRGDQKGRLASLWQRWDQAFPTKQA
jgi:hypothetical protein